MIKKFQIITELCRNTGMVPSPLQYSCLENPMDIGAWWATVQELDMTERLHSLHSLTHPPVQFSSFQLLSHVQLLAILWIAAHQASLSITNYWRSLKLMSIKSVIPSSHLILSRPLLLLPSIAPSIRVFSNESVLCIRWPKCWSFSFNISLSNEYWGLISFRIDWFDILAVQGNLKSLLQYHSSKTSVLWCSAFFMVQLLHPYKTIGKTMALTRQTFVDKVMSIILCF